MNDTPLQAAASSASFPLRELAACCLLKTNRSAEAEALLREGNQDAGAAGYYGGIARAHQGKIGEAIHVLQSVPADSPYKTAAGIALLALLKKAGERRIAARDYAGAADFLTQALTLAPSDTELEQALLSLAQYMPLLYLKSGKRSEAAATWEAAQKKNPTDGQITHCLALLYFFEAQWNASPGRKKPTKPGWARSGIGWRYATRRSSGIGCRKAGNVFIARFLM